MSGDSTVTAAATTTTTAHPATDTDWWTRRSSAPAKAYASCSSLWDYSGQPVAIQAAIYAATGSIALLADLVHNAGDALTAVPLGAAFLLRSARAERTAGLLVVLTILVSAITAGFFAIGRIINPLAPDHLLALILADVIGVIGNAIAARVRLDGGRRLDSPALIADGHHARSDAIVSVGVILSAAAVAIADPIIGLAITLMILHITWESWNTVRGGDARSDHHQDRRARRSAPRPRPRSRYRASGQQARRSRGFGRHVKWGRCSPMTRAQQLLLAVGDIRS